MSEMPPFWFKRPGPIAWALSPIGRLYGEVAARRMVRPAKAAVDIPVLCIGNLMVGGAGKTPTAIALSRIARGIGLRPGFLSRGYGGSVSEPTIVDAKTHNAHDVGDEPLILFQYGITVVSPDRPAGARLLEEQGVDLIIMDDGFQNPSLHKDYSLLVIDAGRGIGNGFCIPAGPVRATLSTQLSQSSAMLLIGKSEAGTAMVRMAARAAKPILNANLKLRSTGSWNGHKVLAYAGIADPSKFYRSLEEAGAEIIERRSFYDHHPFSEEECRELLSLADGQGLTLATTEKDAVRLSRMGHTQEVLKEKSRVLLVDLELENRKMAELVLRDTVKRAEANRFARQ